MESHQDREDGDAPTGAPDAPGGRPPAAERPPGGREYRTAELAETAGITVRTLRFYRERRLLPPPRREGRLAWYDERHLARLRTIAALLERGHTLGGIAELLSAFTAGRDTDHTAELLGLTETQPWAEDQRVRLTPEELAGYYGADSDAENLATSLALGYLVVDGEELVHASRDLLEASSGLTREGIPLKAVLEAGRALRGHADALADVFTQLLSDHVLPRVLDDDADGAGHADGAPGRPRRPGQPVSPAEVKRLTATMERLRPLAKQAVYAEVALALDRRLRAELEARRGAPEAPPE